MYKIHVLATGVGRARTAIFEKNIEKLGGTVNKSFVLGETTHVIVDDQITYETVCSLLKIDCYEVISFKIAKSKWLSLCIDAKKFVECDQFEICGPTHSGEIGNKRKNTSKSYKNDTLLELGCSQNQESDFSDEDILFENNTIPSHVKNKWICMESSHNEKTNHNKSVTDILENLMKTYENMNDKWRALGYKKAIISLKKYPSKITTFEEAKSLQGVGEKLAEKIWEIVESGKLRKLDELSESEETTVLNRFVNVWGAGSKTACMWYAQGFRTLNDLEEKASLTKCQKIGLKYFDELIERMNRSEVQKIESMHVLMANLYILNYKVAAEANLLRPGCDVVVCGSYRRGQATCGDVDILITHHDGSSHIGLFDELISSLTQTGFITDELITAHNGPQQKFLGLCKLPDSKHRRIDIIVTPHSEFYAALVYFTGSGHFNRSMRHMASKMNMSLNEHGLYTGVNGMKIHSGIGLSIISEESIFKYLGVPYRPPEERDY